MGLSHAGPKIQRRLEEIISGEFGECDEEEWDIVEEGMTAEEIDR